MVLISAFLVVASSLAYIGALLPLPHSLTVNVLASPVPPRNLNLLFWPDSPLNLEPKGQETLNRRDLPPIPQSTYPYGHADVSLIIVNPTIIPEESDGGFYIWQELLDLTFAVGNKNPVKEVGVRCSNDSWATYFEVYASYNATDLQNGFERWTLHMNLGYHFTNEEPYYDLQMAAFVSYGNGPRSWDPNNNYFANNKVDATDPLILLGDGVKYDTISGNIIFSGLLRAYPYDRSVDLGPNVLHVRWSSDNWRSIQNSPVKLAQVSSYTWTWSFSVGSKSYIPQNLTYLIVYDSSNGQKVLNLYGNNYVHNLALVTRTNGDIYGFLPVDPSVVNPKPNSLQPFNGIAEITVSFATDIPLGQTVYTLDGKPVGNSSVLLHSTTLRNGLHTITATSHFQNSTTIAKSVTANFTVKNSVQFISEWIPAKPNASLPDPYVAYSIQAVNSKIYVAFEQLIAARYSSFGTFASPEIVYQIPPNHSDNHLQSIAVDDATGNVYLLTAGGNLYKFYANGTMDTSFGIANRSCLVFSSRYTYGSTQLIHAGDVKVVQSCLLISDPNNNRIVSFSPVNGSFIAEASITSPLVMYTDFKYLYVVQELYQHSSSIFTFEPINLTNPVPPLTLPPTASFNATGYFGIYGFAVGSNKVFLALQDTNLIRVSDATTGATLGDWYAGLTPDTPVPGTFKGMQNIVVLSDGTFAVLSAGWSGLERFNQSVL